VNVHKQRPDGWAAFHWLDLKPTLGQDAEQVNQDDVVPVPRIQQSVKKGYVRHVHLQMRVAAQMLRLGASCSELPVHESLDHPDKLRQAPYPTRRATFSLKYVFGDRDRIYRVRPPCVENFLARFYETPPRGRFRPARDE
jgi:hypothetical protein